MDAGGQVRREDPVDLVVAEFLGGTEDSETGVADQNIDAPEIGDGAFDDGPQGGGVAHVEHFDPEQVGVLLAEVGDRARSADRTDDTITSTEQLFGEVTTESTADTGDQPDVQHHRHRPSGGAISSTA